jgi:hypothetical protein
MTRSITLLLLPCVIAAAGPDFAANTEALAVRVLGGNNAKYFSFETISCTTDNSSSIRAGCAQISSDGGKIKVGGSSSVEMAYGLAYYLRKYCHFSFAWMKAGGNQINRNFDTHPPPALKTTVEIKRVVPYSYYQNVVTESYSMWNWDWDR